MEGGLQRLHRELGVTPPRVSLLWGAVPALVARPGGEKAKESSYGPGAAAFLQRAAPPPAPAPFRVCRGCSF